MGGNTLTYTGTRNLFYVQRYGFTVKNGTVVYNGTGGRAPITVSTSTGSTAIGAGTVKWEPVINLEGVTVHSTQKGSGWVIVNYVYDTTINITDSVLWGTDYSALTLRATSQTSVTNKWSGSPNTKVNVENSTVGTGNGYALGVECTGTKISVKDSALVNNEGTGNMYDTSTDAVFNLNSQQTAVDGEWFATVAGKEVGGTAHIVGEVSTREDALTWNLDAQGTLTIGGSGIMRDYAADAAPWADDAAKIKMVKFEDTVTSIGKNAFAGCANLTEVVMNGILTVKSSAFADCTALTDVFYGGTEKQWKKLNIADGNENLTAATIYYAYSPKTEVELDGDITPKFMIDTASLSGTDNYAILTAGEKTVRMEQAQWQKGHGTIRFVSYADVAAKDLSQDVVMAVYNADGQKLNEQTLSPAAAIKTLLAAETGEKQAAQYAAMLHYAAAAQTYFDFNTENPANTGIAAMGDVSSYRNDKSAVSGAGSAVVYGTSCIIDMKPLLKFYFTDSDLTVLVDGKEAELQTSPTEGYYYCLAEVEATDIFIPLTVTIQKDGNTIATITDSVASYCARLYAEGGEKNMLLADALLNYGVASMTADTSDYTDVTISAATEKSLFKVFNRSEPSDTGIALDYAASGVEFEAEFYGDLTMQYNADKTCYFTCFVDGEEVQYTTVNAGNNKKVVIAADVEPGKHTVRLLRDTDAYFTGDKETRVTDSTVMELTALSFTGIKSSVKPTADKDLLIEFVGDSITAGKYTQIDLSGEARHRGTNSYAYLTAEAMNADYSIFARGGCGYFRVETCYKTMNELYPYYNGFAADPVAYAPARQADVVVIALGQNDSDSTHITNNSIVHNPTGGFIPFADIEEAATDLVQQAQATHGSDVKIVLLYNMMGGAWATEFENVAKDLGVYALKTTRDNSGGNSHPSAEAHETIAGELTAFLQNTVLK